MAPTRAFLCLSCLDADAEPWPRSAGLQVGRAPRRMVACCDGSDGRPVSSLRHGVPSIRALPAQTLPCKSPLHLTALSCVSSLTDLHSRAICGGRGRGGGAACRSTANSSRLHNCSPAPRLCSRSRFPRWGSPYIPAHLHVRPCRAAAHCRSRCRSCELAPVPPAELHRRWDLPPWSLA